MRMQACAVVTCFSEWIQSHSAQQSLFTSSKSTSGSKQLANTHFFAASKWLQNHEKLCNAITAQALLDSGDVEVAAAGKEIVAKLQIFSDCEITKLQILSDCEITLRFWWVFHDLFAEEEEDPKPIKEDKRHFVTQCNSLWKRPREKSNQFHGFLATVKTFKLMLQIPLIAQAKSFNVFFWCTAQNSRRLFGLCDIGKMMEWFKQKGFHWQKVWWQWTVDSGKSPNRKDFTGRKCNDGELLILQKSLNTIFLKLNSCIWSFSHWC